jgi:hypothetical protein
MVFKTPSGEMIKVPLSAFQLSLLRIPKYLERIVVLSLTILY